MKLGAIPGVFAARKWAIFREIVRNVAKVATSHQEAAQNLEAKLRFAIPRVSSGGSAARRLSAINVKKVIDVWRNMLSIYDATEHSPRDM